MMKHEFHVLLVTFLLLDAFVPPAKPSFRPIAVFEIVDLAGSAVSLASNIAGMITDKRYAAKMAKKMDELNKVIGQIHSKIQTQNEYINYITRNLPDLLQQVLNKNDLRRYVARINTLYEDYKYYSKNFMAHDNNSLIEYSYNLVSHKTDYVLDIMNNLNSLISPPDIGLGTKGILQLVVNKLAGLPAELACKLNHSPRQLVQNIFDVIWFSLIKGFTMVQFGYAMLKIFNEGQFNNEYERIGFKTISNHWHHLDILIKVQRTLLLNFNTCDPPSSTKGRSSVIPCANCYCFCNEQGSRTDRYLNLRPVMADIKNNRVVTGLRFVKKNKIIHLQIQEGELSPMAYIDPSTVRWVPVDDYSVEDSNVIDGTDYHTLHGEEGINFDDVLATKSRVLTGVRLGVVDSRLTLSVTDSNYNISTGNLDKPAGATKWISNDSVVRTKLWLREIIAAAKHPIENSIPSSYIQFLYTDAILESLQENVIPFVDAQPVAPTIPVALGGAGLYHKGRKFPGGVIAPKIITYDWEFVYNQLPGKNKGKPQPYI